MRITFRQIAKETGVSSATVSNVLNNRGGKVSEATRRRILDAVTRMGYLPVAAPQSQAQPVATKIIGVVFDDLDEVLDYVGAQAYLGLREGARHHGYDLLTILREKPEWAGEREEVRFMDRRSDGIIFVNPYQRQTVLEKLHENHIPAVCCYAHTLPQNTSCAALDENHAMRLLVGHLHQLGHQKIGLVAGPGKQNAHIRNNAFVKACREMRIAVSPRHIFPGTNDHTWTPDLQAIAGALIKARKYQLTALICANDHLAINALKLLKEQKIAVPAGLSLTGFDDMPAAARNGITTIHHPFRNIARASLDLLVRQLQGKNQEPESLLFEPTLVLRKSTSRVS